jgi:hypothetical protein
MTWAEVVELGRRCLIEYEERLKVKGIKPYDPSSVEKFNNDLDGGLDRLNPETLKSAIVDVLEKLAKLQDGFIMSEPTEWAKPNVPTATAFHKNLRITFFHPSSITQGNQRLWIFCYYYPA